MAAKSKERLKKLRAQKRKLLAKKAKSPRQNKFKHFTDDASAWLIAIGHQIKTFIHNPRQMLHPIQNWHEMDQTQHYYADRAKNSNSWVSGLGSANPKAYAKAHEPKKSKGKAKSKHKSVHNSVHKGISKGKVTRMRARKPQKASQAAKNANTSYEPKAPQDSINGTYEKQATQARQNALSQSQPQNQAQDGPEQ